MKRRIPLGRLREATKDASDLRSWPWPERIDWARSGYQLSAPYLAAMSPDVALAFIDVVIAARELVDESPRLLPAISPDLIRRRQESALRDKLDRFDFS